MLVINERFQQLHVRYERHFIQWQNQLDLGWRGGLWNKSPVAFSVVFNSACAINGNHLAKSRKKVKNIPMVPTNIPTSTKLGE